MKLLYTPNYTADDHMQKVKAHMVEDGSPEIPIVFLVDRGVWVALEGSHRMRAAAELGIPVVYEEIDPSEPYIADDIHGWKEGMTARDVAELILLGDCGRYDISDHIPRLLYDRGNEVDGD